MDWWVMRRLLLLGRTGTGGLEHRGRGHQVLNVLAKHLVLGAQLEILLLDGIDALRQVVQSVLELQNLCDEAGLLLPVVLGHFHGLQRIVRRIRRGAAVGEGGAQRVHGSAIGHSNRRRGLVVRNNNCLFFLGRNNN